uniref:Uncharacterized protein n=1 Tax=Arundo donax TaxID=35708 RepID=A0A0A9ANI7_ARUDO
MGNSAAATMSLLASTNPTEGMARHGNHAQPRVLRPKAAHKTRHPRRHGEEAAEAGRWCGGTRAEDKDTCKNRNESRGPDCGAHGNPRPIRTGILH